MIQFDNELNKRVVLEYKGFVRYLGTLIDSDLSWKHHTDLVAIKISQRIGLITKSAYFVLGYALLEVYGSLIAPDLTYSLTAWGQACKSCLDKLLKLQKRAFRFICIS